MVGEQGRTASASTPTTVTHLLSSDCCPAGPPPGNLVGIVVYCVACKYLRCVLSSDALSSRLQILTISGANDHRSYSYT